MGAVGLKDMVLMTDQVDATTTVALDHCTFVGWQRLRPHA